MRTESVYMMIAIGLALGEQVNRVLGGGVYWVKVPRRNRRIRGPLAAGAADETSLSDEDANYFEKLATEYEIIPLMSKLI